MNAFFYLLWVVMSFDTLKVYPMQVSDSLVVELKDPKEFQQQLMDVCKQTSLKSLTINLQENRGWVVFAQFPGRSDIENEPSYSLKHTVGNLPEGFGKLNRLEFLKISFLGLKTLPKSIVQLIALEELDISFNQLDFSFETEKIMQLTKLKLLKAYGCRVTEEHVGILQQTNPRLRILYTNQHHFEEFNIQYDHE